MTRLSASLGKHSSGLSYARKCQDRKTASVRLADLLYLFGDWPGGVGEQGDRGPARKLSRGLFL